MFYRIIVYRNRKSLVTRSIPYKCKLLFKNEMEDPVLN